MVRVQGSMFRNRPWPGRQFLARDFGPAPQRTQRIVRGFTRNTSMSDRREAQATPMPNWDTIGSA